MKPCIVSTTTIIFIMTLFITRIWSHSAAAFVVTPSHWRRRIPVAISSVRSTSTSASNHAAGDIEEKGEKEEHRFSSSLSSRTCLILPPSNDFLDLNMTGIAQTLKDLEDLHLPHVSSLDEAIQYDNGNGGLTHSLTLEPYSYASVETFAIALQPLSSPNPQNENRRRKKVRKSKAPPPRMKPLCIDFMQVIEQRQPVKKGGELIVKAMGGFKVKSKSQTTATATGNTGASTRTGTPSVWDMTTGFGQDSIMLAMAGAAPNVIMMERDDIVSTLVSDALRRLSLVANLDHDTRDVQIARDLSNRMTLIQGDGVSIGTQLLQDMDEGGGGDVTVEPRPSLALPDICYLDPMFPPRTKSSAVKKKMQLLHGLFDSVTESTRLEEERSLLDVALSVAQSRVVVKRPIHAPPLGEVVRGSSQKDEEEEVGLQRAGKEKIQQPSFQVKGSINRFDVYLTQGHS